MTDPTEDYLAAIAHHSEGLAAAARDNLSAPVEHCPGWTVADLVWHVTEVHWFWRTIAGELLSEPPDEDRRPARSPDEALVDVFLAGAVELVDTLRATDQSAGCWTWANTQKDVAFVTRHQVQEAAVHHWDAAHAADEAIGPDFFTEAVATDSVEEFLEFSLSTDADPGTGLASLDGAFWFRTPRREWYVSDGDAPGTLTTSTTRPADYPDEVVVQCSATTLLLWLYGRVPDEEFFGDISVDTGLLGRFRALCFTD